MLGCARCMRSARIKCGLCLRRLRVAQTRHLTGCPMSAISRKPGGACAVDLASRALHWGGLAGGKLSRRSREPRPYIQVGRIATEGGLPGQTTHLRTGGPRPCGAGSDRGSSREAIHSNPADLKVGATASSKRAKASSNTWASPA